MMRSLVVAFSFVAVGCAFSPRNEGENADDKNSGGTTQLEGATDKSQLRGDDDEIDEPSRGNLSPFGAYDLSHPSASAKAAADFFPHPAIEDRAARREVERDLGLTITRVSTEPYEGIWDPGFTVTLVNQSRTTSHPIVLAKDGSMEGWREPFVYFTVEKRSANGAWEPAVQSTYGRCGNYKRDWFDDIVSLGPGESKSLAWVLFAGYDDAIEDADFIRVRAHYEYRRGNVFRSVFAAGPTLPDSIKDVPAFSLTSDPIEVMIERPLRIDAQITAPLPSEEGIAAKDFLTVTATNITSHDVVIPKTTGRVALEFQGTSVDLGERTNRSQSLDLDYHSPNVGDDMVTLAPGQTITLDEQLEGISTNEYWKYEVGELRNIRVVRMRASFTWEVLIARPNATPDDVAPFDETMHRASGPWTPFKSP